MATIISETSTRTDHRISVTGFRSVSYICVPDCNRFIAGIAGHVETRRDASRQREWKIRLSAVSHHPKDAL